MPEKNITSDTPDFSLKDKVLHNNLCVFIIEGFGREKDGNRGKLIGSNLVIFCYKDFRNSRCTNLLANWRQHLLFIHSQSKTVMQKLIINDFLESFLLVFGEIK